VSILEQYARVAWRRRGVGGKVYTAGEKAFITDVNYINNSDNNTPTYDMPLSL